jgi:O-antigen ligase
MPSSGHDPRGPAWSWVLTGVLLACSVLVPCVFTTRINAVFAVPKLAVLWAALAVSLAVFAVGVVWSTTPPRLARELWFVDVAVGAFVALNLAAWVFSTDRDQSLYGERLQYQGLLTLLLYVGFFYVARLAITDDRRVRLLFLAVAIGATLVAAYALVQRAGLDPVWEGYLPSGRVFSSIGQSNALAAYLVLAIPVSAALLFDAGKALRAAVALAVGAMVAALVLTRSRGGFLGSLTSLGVLAVGWRPALGVSARRFWSGVAAAGVAVTLIVVGAAFAGALPRVSPDEPSTRFHLDAWRVAAQVAVEHPVLGTGPETFPDVFPRYSHAVLPPERAAALDAFRVESPHNVYLGIAAGSGIPALVAYLAVVAGFFVATIRAARSANRDSRIVLAAALAAVSGYLVTSAFMTADVTSTWLFWVLMGSALGLVSQPIRQSARFQVRP